MHSATEADGGRSSTIAREIKRQLLTTYERVELGQAPKEALRVVVVGGGPTVGC